MVDIHADVAIFKFRLEVTRTELSLAFCKYVRHRRIDISILCNCFIYFETIGIWLIPSLRHLASCKQKSICVLLILMRARRAISHFSSRIARQRRWLNTKYWFNEKVYCTILLLMSMMSVFLSEHSSKRRDFAKGHNNKLFVFLKHVSIEGEFIKCSGRCWCLNQFWIQMSIALTSHQPYHKLAPLFHSLSMKIRLNNIKAHSYYKLLVIFSFRLAISCHSHSFTAHTTYMFNVD